MSLQLVVKSSDPPIGALVMSEIVSSKKKINISVTWSNEWTGSGNVQLFDKDDNLVGATNNNVARYLARTKDVNLYGGNEPLERTEVDNWLSFSIRPLRGSQSVNKSLVYLDRILMPKTWLVAKRLTIADICVFSNLFEEEEFISSAKYPNIARWYKLVLSFPAVKSALDSVSRNRTISAAKIDKTRGNPAEKETKGAQSSNSRKQEGKFIEFPGAEMGKVVVRFPPEASGYLHIGHAKAALLNQYYAEAYQGKLIMRFDDTNPAKETVEFEKAILEDLEMLQIKPDHFTHSSDYFDLMLQYCNQLIKESKAFVDDTPPEEMKEQREQRLPSINRDNSIEKNIDMWEEMKKGTQKGQECCVRAKINYQSTNGCLRDPTIYRCKPEPHTRTGTKYKVYPTYDFACPIVDAVEGVTLTLRTTEYHDRDAQFYWFIDALGLNRPYIWEYSRLNMTNTVLSKRKLTWFVADGLVDGWDDPRFPTVRGILRRGMTVEGLKQFIIAQGSSRSIVFMEWDKIWSFNKKVIDPIAVRYTALDYNELVPVKVDGAKSDWITVQNHPKNPSIGTKKVRVSPNILIEKVDAEALIENQNATFINWGNLFIKKVKKEKGSVVEVEASLNLENKAFKNTLKLTWLSVQERKSEDCNESKLVPCYCVYFDHIISKPVLAKDEDFRNYIAKETRKEVQMLGETELKKVKKGEIIQLQRKGFFRCDVSYTPADAFTSREQPAILFHIPDGHSTSPITQIANHTVNKNVLPTNQKNDDSITKQNEKIVNQGNKVRNLKNAKTDKGVVEAEVEKLLAFKAEYKTLAGVDWKSGAFAKSEVVAILDSKMSSSNTNELFVQIQKQETRTLEELKKLMSLKTKYKKITGNDWKSAVALPVIEVVSNSSDSISNEITKQGNKVRELKFQNADKAKIDHEVKELLRLKAEYKSTTGQDWKPEASLPVTEPVSNSADGLSNEITKQGDKVRELKSQKADKTQIDQEVRDLLRLKAEYKSTTGQDWKPEASLPVTEPVSHSVDGLLNEITKQGDRVREMKSQKADKTQIDQEVRELLRLKAEYKSTTGQDWKFVASTPTSNITNSVTNDSKINEISNKIIQQGDKIRQLKSSKAEKNLSDQEVKILLGLKNKFKAIAGEEWKPSTVSNEKKGKREETASKESVKDSKNFKSREKMLRMLEKDNKAGKENSKTGTRLGLEAKKSENLADWYSQVITKSEMIEYYNVSGCYILRPWSFSIWEVIRDYINGKIKKLGVENCYFPIFVSQAALEKEKTHITDFAPEVAWVTKSGDSNLAEPIAIRPTSETVMYPAYAKWLSSYRDLPLKLNQWNNVVRWEFKHPQPFLRTREFLWQEGHTAFANKAEADEEVFTILNIYASVYEDLLAIPVIKGRKTEKEKFAGGDYTTTVEAYISASGRAIQGATSHHLGQNFSKMFDIQVEGTEEGGEKTFVYQNSWGLTTRTIGVMVMVHGDDKGLVLPPNVACIQVIIVPCGITASATQDQRQLLLFECEKLEQELNSIGNLRIRGDYRDNYSPGWKFNHWELKGVPLRIELGPKDLEKKQVTLVRRDTAERFTKSRSDAYLSVINLLEEIHSNLFNKAKKELINHIIQTHEWNNFCSQLDCKNLILAPFCGEISCEDNIKTDSVREDFEDDPGAPLMGAKSLCIPFDQPKNDLSNASCIHRSCQSKPKFYTLFGRSY